MERVRCPAEGCGAVFRVEDERLGRNVYCLSCGTRMTARPAGVDHVLERRERLTRGSTGDVIAAGGLRLEGGSGANRLTLVGSHSDFDLTSSERVTAIDFETIEQLSSATANPSY